MCLSKVVVYMATPVGNEYQYVSACDSYAKDIMVSGYLSVHSSDLC